MAKHGVSFEQASTIFLDPRMVSVFDTEHSEHEDRWATIGIDRNGSLLVAVHTFQQVDADSYRIRIISARKATRKESKQYQEENK
ncbi:MAG: BrnT family toxin [Thermodesulfovibrionales bacterium]|nr:BrnT family toxin [Thermodesulfovibrionales bacterium]